MYMFIFYNIYFPNCTLCAGANERMLVNNKIQQQTQILSILSVVAFCCDSVLSFAADLT